MLAEKITMEAQQKRPIGRPRKEVDSPLSEIIKKHFGGDNETAAQVWDISPAHLSNVLRGHRAVSPGMKIKIHLSTQIPLKDLKDL